MKCFYINESMLQDTTFSKNALQRFLSYYYRHHGEVLLISAVGSITIDEIPEDIHYIISPSTFSFASIQGEVMPHMAYINTDKLQEACSGCCIEYDTETKKSSRIYFDIIDDPTIDLTNRVMDEVKSMLEEHPIKKHFYN